MSPIDGEDLISWLDFHYTQEQQRIELIKLVKAKQAERMAHTPNMWQRFISRVKEFFK